MKSFNTWNEQQRREERRFRASIYVDVFVPMTENLETDRERAERIVKKISDRIPFNSYVGGVAHYTPHNLLNPLDRDI